MSRTLEIPDDVYDALTEAARAQGLSPVEWLTSKLPAPHDTSSNGLAASLKDLVGAVDSRCVREEERLRTPFGASLAAKFERQGLKMR